MLVNKRWVEKTEEVIKNGESRDTGNIEHKTQNKNKQNEKEEQQKKHWVLLMVIMPCFL